MYRLFILGLILLSIGAKAQYGANKGTLNVRFVVDASSLSGVKNFGVRGGLSPLSWEYTTELHDEDGNGVYEGEITISNAINFLEYKYVYGERDLTWEFEGQNRILIVDSTQMEVKDTWGLRNILEIEKLPTLSAEALSEDFKLLKQALLEIHPGIYRYNTKAQVDSIFKQYKSECLRPQTYREAFLNFTRLTAAFKCGHTYPNFYNQSDFIQEVVFGQQDKLPFAFRVLDKRMFVIQGVGNGSHIPLGSEIVSIDGVPVQSLLEEVAALIKADGGNEYKRFADLNTFGIEGTYEVFDVYFPLLHPPKNGQYAIRIIQPNSTLTEEFFVSAMGSTQRNVALSSGNSQPENTDANQWELIFLEEKTALLKLGTFDVFQFSFDWKAFLENAFREIEKRKIENLIIDIRWNEGGQDEVLLVLGQYIIVEPTRIEQRKDLVRYEKVSDGLRPYLFTWENSFFDLSSAVKPYNDNFFQFRKEPTLEIKPSKNVFRGQVYLLVNGANSSATFYFAEFVQERGLATLVGEPTGGNLRGLNGGVMFFLRLPNSTIEVDIPIIGSFSEDSASEGITPDFVIRPTVEDLVKGEDRALLFIEGLIQKK